MQKIRVELGERSYSIVIGSNMLKDIGAALTRFEFSPRIALVSNPTVYGIYGALVSQSVRDSGFDLVEIIIPDGEEYKSLEWLEKIFSDLLAAKLDRRSALIALGGGVIGDITGFAAASYMRGIDFVQIPTTLLAQVDSSVGGKTGINHPLGKNMIGAFWQPRIVWIDRDTLRSLPRREFLAGLAEAIKYGVIRDKDLFDFLEADRDSILGLGGDALTYLIKRSCEIKSEVVAQDERESGLRAILNYGHTVGHAIETASGYKRYLHGEAVAIGMCVESDLAANLGFLERDKAERIRKVIGLFGLPSAMPPDLDVQEVMSCMQLDKKAVGGELTFVFPTTIGDVKIKSGVLLEEVRKILQSA